MGGNFDERHVNLPGLALGGILILLGLTFLFGQIVGQVFHVNLGAVVWPFLVIVPGVLLLAGAVTFRSELSEPLAILGGMATATGLLLCFQNTTGLWATWAYAWALAVPGGAGFGLTLFGLMQSRPDKVRAGIRVMTAAAGIFIMGLIFFELIIGISGFGLGRFWPLLLIAGGLIALAGGLRRPRIAE